MIKNYRVWLFLLTLLTFSSSGFSQGIGGLNVEDPQNEGGFSLRSVADRRILAAGFYRVNARAFASGTPVGASILVLNNLTGETVSQVQAIVRASPSSNSVIVEEQSFVEGVPSEGELRASFDSENSALILRFSIDVEDQVTDPASIYQPSGLFDLPAIADAANPFIVSNGGEPTTFEQYRVIFLVELSDVVNQNQAVANSGVIGILSVRGDGSPAVVSDQ